MKQSTTSEHHDSGPGHDPSRSPAHDRLEEFLPRAGSGPLSGQIVVDFSRVLAGPYSTMMLADLGATVIKVEGPKGDDTRHWAPPVREADATYYLSINRNKYDLVLDFTDPMTSPPRRSSRRRPISSSRTSNRAGWRSTTSTTTASPRPTRQSSMPR